MTQTQPLLLLVNDDGFDAPGMRMLVEAVAPLGRLVVVAPHFEQSWMARGHRSYPTGHNWADTREVELFTRESPIPGHEAVIAAWSVPASPARCIRVALDILGIEPDLIVSGINYGWNAGTSLTESGTVGVAWEAAAAGYPAVALSHDHLGEESSFPAVIHHSRRAVEAVLREGLPDGIGFVSVNFPTDPAFDAEHVVTSTSHVSPYRHWAERTESGRWKLLSEANPFDVEPEPDSDLAALRDGHVSVTYIPKRLGHL